MSAKQNKVQSSGSIAAARDNSVSTCNVPPPAPPLTLTKGHYRGRKQSTSLFKETLPQMTNTFSLVASMVQLNSSVAVVKKEREEGKARKWKRENLKLMPCLVRILRSIPL